jgi:hypothetical protein
MNLNEYLASVVTQPPPKLCRNCRRPFPEGWSSDMEYCHRTRCRRVMRELNDADIPEAIGLPESMDELGVDAATFGVDGPEQSRPRRRRNRPRP